MTLRAKRSNLFFDCFVALLLAMTIITQYLAAPTQAARVRDQIVRIQAMGPDPLNTLDSKDEGKQWYLSKIQVPRAWEKTTGSSDIIVAVVDTGIDGQHEDLQDGRVIRGLIHYCQKLNASEDECLSRVHSEVDAGVNSDDNGHGTLIAGIIGAEANNGKGIAGINWKVKLMPVKVLDASGSGLSSDVAYGIKWAVDHGAKIINLSIGGSGLGGADVLQEAINYAFKSNVLVVAAAGNDSSELGTNLNSTPSLPVCADGGQNAIVGVTAVDAEDRKAGFSNYGSNCVDIAAPGAASYVNKQTKKGIVSTYYDPSRPGKHDLYAFAVGTSLAAPMVSGVASLTLSVFPDLGVKVLRDRLTASVDNIDQYNTEGCGGGSCVGQIGVGRLDAYKAVSALPLFSSGVIIQGPTGIFLVERGLRRPVAEFVFKQRFAGVATVATDQSQVDSLLVGPPLPPVDGTLIKEPGSPAVYIVEEGLLRTLSYPAFVSRGLKFENVTILPAEIISTYTHGPDAALQNGGLVKSPDHPAVFVFENGSRRLVSYFVFKQRGFDTQQIADLSLEELAKYPVDAGLYPPFDGALMKGRDSATVYVVEGGKLRGLTAVAFTTRGFNFASIKTVPQEEITQYQMGEDVLE